ncbi:NAD-dependent succinate-semialdehyde dehydrogenase [Fuerstiella marisgermanici]|uniref:Succinate-semialdehyde dehydrogenase [NADP(+)] 1 n=1 Tax=Fuerstiella marisgermanici TaxID=1891926 RepID=A0A1P8WE00_9PLAN|nr:NAD-dependent succinate-semialdehyde dehydrogenase [Fuerstiella marisgermanici]APZ92274.1 Succinate-semialdehyde dehydrogenase [NADP(+)] 1 [Fuerstiella marisgermanici]
MSITSINPATGETLKTYEPLTKEQTMDKVAAAQKAFADWQETTFDHRKSILLTFAKALRERTDECAKLITVEMGKRIAEARKEILFCAEITEFYANGAEEFLANQPMDTDDAEAYIQYAPIGVLMGVMPWNFPFYQVVRYAMPNIMAGNTVLVKHAGNVPQCAEKIQNLFDESGLPEGVFTNLLIPTEFVETIIEDDRIQGVSLTGSERAGAAVAAAAGKNLKRSVLELGGNDPFIVLEDADLDAVVEMAVKGRMVNTGQSCVAAKRFIVVESLADDFLSAFKSKLADMKLGDPIDEDTEVGPLSTESAADNLDKQVQSAINAGATVVLGGDRPDCKGAFFNPTILTDVTPDMPTYDQELFGPVATVYVVKDEAAAIKLANDSSYGLGGSVYTKDIERGRKVAEQIDTGMMFINQPTQSQADLPFGGTKNSGYGRELSHLGILEFVNKKLIHTGSRS